MYDFVMNALQTKRNEKNLRQSWRPSVTVFSNVVAGNDCMSDNGK